MTRPYHQIPIQESNEPLVPIPLEQFAVESPHPYEKLGAPYGGKSPYYLRQSVVDGLIEAQSYLQELYPGWQIQIFDAYRPVAVQQFMVDYAFKQLLQDRALELEALSATKQQALWQEVYKIWAVPSNNQATPPPHSTGAAVDLTLVDEQGNIVEMGSPIDELSERSHPDYYAQSTIAQQQQYHAHRQLLNQIMVKANFRRNPLEWWHFSLGDQMWAWLCNLESKTQHLSACYGRV